MNCYIKIFLTILFSFLLSCSNDEPKGEMNSKPPYESVLLLEIVDGNGVSLVAFGTFENKFPDARVYFGKFVFPFRTNFDQRGCQFCYSGLPDLNVLDERIAQNTVCFGPLYYGKNKTFSYIIDWGNGSKDEVSYIASEKGIESVSVNGQKVENVRYMHKYQAVVTIVK